VAVAVDPLGRPLLLLSKLAEHTTNLVHRREASLLLSELHCGLLGREPQEDPLALGRVTILGLCAPVADEEREGVRATFLAHQPSAARYVDFADFAFYRLEPTALRWVGGFGRMSWVTADDYRTASAG
jgi:putative heme iron utilization protein